MEISNENRSVDREEAYSLPSFTLGLLAKLVDSSFCHMDRRIVVRAVGAQLCVLRCSGRERHCSALRYERHPVGSGNCLSWGFQHGKHGAPADSQRNGAKFRKRRFEVHRDAPTDAYFVWHGAANH